MTTNNKGKIVTRNGVRRIFKNGAVAVYNVNGECIECYETCYSFTVTPTDAIAQVGNSIQNYRSDDEIMEALSTNGRHVFKFKKGKYSVRYQGRYFVMGCGLINCAHYHGYFVTAIWQNAIILNHQSGAV
jgi:hypothetical protein